MEICEVTCNAHQTRTERLNPPKTRMDFGGTDSYFLHLRRIGKYLADCDIKKDFSLYLGEYQGKFVIGIKNPFSFDIIVELEIFDSLDELKKVWELD